MKKVLTIVLALAIITIAFVGCANENKKPDETTQAGFDTTKSISVISREDGSGTRGAFIELTGVEEADEKGEKVDKTTTDAVITNNTSVMITTVASDDYSIGYISLGSLNDTIKALKVDGVAPSVETIKDGTYKIARPFNIATKGEVSDVTQDFINFILSTQGQKVITDNGYISNDGTEDFKSNNATGKIKIAGSSSVTPVMEKLKEEYLKTAKDVTIEIQQSDSTTGMNSATEGICDIGMASRELKDSETGAGLTPVKIAMDGIAIVANKNCTVDNISTDSIKGIYTGTIKTWSEVK